MAMEMHGLDELQNQLDNIGKEVRDATKPRNMPLTDLFTPAFMRNYTNFTSFDALLEAGGFRIKSQKDFDAIPDAKLNKHIAKTTKFNSFDDMLQKAYERYLNRKLGI